MSPPRGPYAKTAEMRDTVLDTTLRLVDELGYEEVTFTAVANECGMSKAGLLYHFDSWHDLLLAALERRRRLNVDRATGSSGWSDALVRTFELNARAPGVIALFSAMAGHAAASPKTDSSGRQYFERHYEEATELFSKSIRDDQASGRIDADIDPTTVARILIAVSDGLQIQWLLNPEVDMAEHFKVLDELITTRHAANREAAESGSETT